MWAALPVMLFSQPGAITEPTSDIWKYGDDFIEANLANHRRLLLIGRIQIIVLSLLTALLMAAWTHELFGLRPALCAMMLWCLSPTVLGAASLVTTDLGAAFLFVLTLSRAWKLAESPGYASSFVTGLCLGLAQLAKYTGVLLFGLVPMIWCIRRWRSEDVQKLRLHQFAGYVAVTLTVGLSVLNAGYLFQRTGYSLAELSSTSSSMKSVKALIGPLVEVPLPLPADFVEGIDHERHVMEGQHAVYLDGQWSLTGFRSYFLIAMWYKLPHVLQLLLFIGTAGALIHPRNKCEHRMLVALSLTPVLLIAIASSSSLQLGMRYILPAFPFMVMLAARSAGFVSSLKPTHQLAATGVLLALSALNLRHHPSHLAYFNELAGGPSSGYVHLIDSNIDWGQDVHALAEYLKVNPARKLYLACLGTFPPHRAGIEFESPPEWLPQPGTYAISVSLLMGRPIAIRNPDGTSHSTDFGVYSYLRYFEPVDAVGQSILIFHVTPDDARNVREQISRTQQF